MATVPSPRLKQRPRIEIIPLIDIMFFLLATFMIVSISMVHNQGITLNLPGASTAEPSDPDAASVTLSVRPDGSVYYNAEPMTVPQLAAELRRLKASAPQTRVILQGDRNCPFGRVIEVFDQIRQIGLNKLIIQTQKPAAS